MNRRGGSVCVSQAGTRRFIMDSLLSLCAFHWPGATARLLNSAVSDSKQSRWVVELRTSGWSDNDQYGHDLASLMSAATYVALQRIASVASTPRFWTTAVCFVFRYRLPR